MHRLRAVSLVFVLSLILTGCAGPSQQYGFSKAEGVYFALPNSWHQISSKSLNAHEATSTTAGAAEKLALVKWQVGYSTDPKIGPKEVFNFEPTDSPIAFARVRSLFPDEINAVSYNTLRDLIVPITDWVTNPNAATPEFSIIDDYEVAEKSARGVRTIFSFTKNGRAQTVDQTAMVSTDRQTIYIFIIRCSDACYAKNKVEMTKISDSFTVRGAK